MLHQTSRYVLAHFNGKLPETAPELEKLAGIGKYTAGAIASIAFNQKAPVLDGNVIRVLTRIFAIPEDVARRETTTRLWTLAEFLLPDKKTGDFNQALMELGATICSPALPQCPRCPVGTVCRARQMRREHCYPVQSKKERSVFLKMTALVLVNNKKFWIEKQPEHKRWGGLWTFPFFETGLKKVFPENTRRHQPALLLTLRYTVTKYRVRLDVYILHGKNNFLRNRKTGRWISLKNLRKIAFPSPHRKIANDLLSKRTP